MNVRIQKIDDFGRGIAFIHDKITFIPNALEDEIVEYKIVKEKRKYSEGVALRIFNENKERVCPRCPYYLDCGGCDLEHFSFAYENRFKIEKAKNILNKFARTCISDIELVSGQDYFYRNKITFTVKDGRLGLLRKNSNDFVEVNQCFLLDSSLNEKIEMLKYLVRKELGIEKIMIRIGNITGEVMLALYGKVREPFSFTELCDSLIINNIPITHCFITSCILDKKFHIREKSFFQVNNEIVEYLYRYIRELIRDLGSLYVLDLYCGVGTIGIVISDLVLKVIGVEVVSEAILDANENKKLNHIENISFINGKVEDVILKIQDGIDTVIVDPPRSGLDKVSRNCLLHSNISNIIYISCDVSTLARDLLVFKSKYAIVSIKLFNMFPRTRHVECVCVLCLR